MSDPADPVEVVIFPTNGREKLRVAVAIFEDGMDLRLAVLPGKDVLLASETLLLELVAMGQMVLAGEVGEGDEFKGATGKGKRSHGKNA